MSYYQGVITQHSVMTTHLCRIQTHILFDHIKVFNNTHVHNKMV